MPDNLQLGPESSGNATLAILRETKRPLGPLNNGERLSPGVFLALDPQASINVNASSSAGNLFFARFEANESARWIALHIELGKLDLQSSMLFGIACRTTSRSSVIFTPCLRSGTEHGFTDTFFPKKGVAFMQESLHLDALSIAEHPSLIQTTDWRELIFFFSTSSGEIEVTDIRLFSI